MNINRTSTYPFYNHNSSILSTLHYHNKTSLSQDESTTNSESLLFVERITTHITLIVTIIGLIGNACTIIVLNRQSMRKWRSSMLLSALAVVDFLYLFIIFLSILDTLSNQMIGLHRSLILCQVTVYITHICSFLSSNFTLSFTLQRFVAVLFPLHAERMISHRSSIITIILLTCFGCGFYIFSFFLTNLSHGQCREDENYPALFPLLIFDTCFTFLLPFICISIFNCAIVYKLRLRKKFASIFEGSLSLATVSNNRQRLNSRRLTKIDDYHEEQCLYKSNSNNDNYIPLKNGNQSINEIIGFSRKVSTKDIELPTTVPAAATTTTFSNELAPISSSISTSNRQGISQRTTKMLVICSTTFLLFNSPYCAVLLYCIISKIVLTRTLSILRHFYFMSFCLNFFLYSLCGHRFRHELILLLKTCCQKWISSSTRPQWLRFEKHPHQHSFTRVINQANV